mmetsp:Transcript_9244/g.17329  ORF Transcript_9244/g.17329 Transcript_9244/m.17329 type:complete len:211 (-) Transcript_9244:754-1386(-)
MMNLKRLLPLVVVLLKLTNDAHFQEIMLIPSLITLFVAIRQRTHQVALQRNLLTLKTRLLMNMRTQRLIVLCLFVLLSLVGWAARNAILKNTRDCGLTAVTTRLLCFSPRFMKPLCRMLVLSLVERVWIKSPNSIAWHRTCPLFTTFSVPAASLWPAPFGNGWTRSTMSAFVDSLRKKCRELFSTAGLPNLKPQWRLAPSCLLLQRFLRN